MDTETKSPDIKRLESDRDWYGYLTLDNCDAVAGRIRSMLAGQRYTWVSCNEGLRDYFPEVRTGQRLRDDVRIDRDTLDGGTEWAHISAGDTYGVWGLGTTVPDQKTAHRWAADDKKRKRLTCLHITRGRHDGGRIEIEHYAPVGARLYWVIAVEPRQDGDDG